MAKYNLHAERWTIEDFRNKLCPLHHVGEIKPVAPVPPPTPLDPDDVTIEDVLEGFKRAYCRMGGDAGLARWGENNPTEFYKLLARMSTAKVVGSTTSPSIIFNLGGELGRIIEGNKSPHLNGDATVGLE